MSRSNWNLEMLVFKEKGKPEYPDKNLWKESREPTTNSTHVLRRVRESNPGHIGGRRALSLLRQPCSPDKWEHQMFIGNKMLCQDVSHLKIYKRLSLSIVFSNTNSKTFYEGNDFTPWIKYLLLGCCFFERFYGVSSWQQIILCKSRDSFVSRARSKVKMALNLSRRHHIIFSLRFGAMHVF